MGEKKGGLFNIIVVVVIASFFLFAVNAFFPGILSDIFGGASDLVDTGFGTAQQAASNPAGAGGGAPTP